MHNQPKPQFMDVAVAPRSRTTRATISHRAKVHGLCAYCGRAFTSHTLQDTVDCANGRS